MRSYHSAIVCLLAALLFGSCGKDDAGYPVGELPVPGWITMPSVIFRSAGTSNTRQAISMSEGEDMASDRIFCRITSPAYAELVLTAAVATGDKLEMLVDNYNSRYGTELKPLPPGNVEIANNGTMTIEQGAWSSDRIDIRFRSDGLTEGTYLMPVTVSSDDFVSLSIGKDVLYYGINIRKTNEGNHAHWDLDPDHMVVFYLNTRDYQPLLADIWLVEKLDPESFEVMSQFTYGHIVNLREVNLSLDRTSGRAMLSLDSDISHVLENADRYIRPLQDRGRKVCLCLEPDGEGLGFCNMSDAQTEDFVNQVKTCVELYGLDGVNFYDRGRGYDRADAPIWDNGSYPKLIKAMYEALHPSGKIVTLADYGTPTGYFWDIEATGGIEVGEYLDYAWSGYMSEDEDVLVTDPWMDKESADRHNIITFMRRNPIAGMSPDRYGCFCIPMYHDGSDFVLNFGASGFAEWCTSANGLRKNNIAVLGDLVSREEGLYDMTWKVIPDLFWSCWGQGSQEGDCIYSCLVDTDPTLSVLNPGDFEKDW